MKAIYKKNLFLNIVLIVGWLGFETLFYSIAHDAQVSYERELIKQANIYYEDIQDANEWNTNLGGIYTLNKVLNPNTYDHKSVLNTDKGRFVKINPAWMTRMLAEESNKEILRYALVSNTPLNPDNKAKGFYAKALEKIAKTKTATAEYEIDEEGKRLNYIHPIYYSQKCLSCHTRPEDIENAQAGGVIVDIDASFALDRTKKGWRNFYIVSLLFTFAIFIIYFFLLKLNRQRSHYIKLNIELEKKLKEHIHKLNQTLEASGLGYWHWNVQTGEHIVDNHWLQILGLTRSDIRGHEHDWNNRIHPNDLKNVESVIKNTLETHEQYVVEFRMLHKNGQYIWIQGSGGVTAIDEKGVVSNLSGTHQDITQRKLLEIEHTHNASYLNTLFENNPNIIIVTDGHEIIKANHSFFRLFSEYDSLDTFKKEHQCICDFFKHSESDEFITSEYGEWIEEVLTLSEPIVNIGYSNHDYYYNVHAKKVYDEGAMRMLVTFSDITETYKLRKRFEELSIIDELTKAYNRRYFNKVYKDELNRARREGNGFSLMIMDIDNFKLYNDHYGHDEGDEALKALSREIQKCMKRSNEFFFRLGGEEFGVVFNATSKEDALGYSEKICRSVERLNIVHKLNQPYEKLTISIGVCYIDSKGSFNAKDIYRKADRALYLAKDNGRNRVEIFDID